MTAERIRRPARWAPHDRGVRGVGRRAARVACPSLVVLMLGISAMNVANSYVGRDFMTRSSSAIRRLHLDGLAYIGCSVSSCSRCCSGSARNASACSRPMAHARARARLLGIATRTGCARRGDRQPRPADRRRRADVHHTTLSFVLMVLNGTITIIAFSACSGRSRRCCSRRVGYAARARCSRFGSGAH